MPKSVPRSYVCDLPGGTNTSAIQMTGNQTLKTVMLSVANAAAGKIEVSLVAAPQIGTVQPTDDVLVRFSQSATAGPSQNVVVPISTSVKGFQTIYVHQTGAGNLGTIVLS